MFESELRAILGEIPQGAECPFPQEEFDARLTALRARMAEKDFELLLVSGAENIFYLSGQQTPGYYTFQCLAIPANGSPFLVIRGLEAPNARLKSTLSDISGYPDDADPAAAVAAVLKERGWAGCCGIEPIPAAWSLAFIERGKAERELTSRPL